MTGNNKGHKKSPIRLLVVDDSALTIEIIRRMLVNEEDIDLVASARSGAEALALIKELDPDVICTDFHMPGMDGIELARLAAERHPGLRIMFITGFAAVALKAEETAPPGARVLAKPVHLRELVVEVERMLAA